MGSGSGSILVVDDEASVRSLLAAMLLDSTLELEFATNADEALAALRRNDFQAVLSDVCMPGRSGIQFVNEARRIRPRAPVVLMTGYASVDSAVEAIRAGAFDYLTKPFTRREVVGALERALESRRREEGRKPDSHETAPRVARLVGASPAMRRIHELIEKVAGSPANVLITGETGTGKELVARTLHAVGARSQGPFIAINCTAIPEGLLESELFGHVRGAFTGAVGAKKGLFEIANGGTLFLDEIGDLGSGLQAKLLRVLQEREVRPVGGTRSTRIDVRIIAATHRDLQRDVQEGRFRMDLFYRLNVIPIDVPPLRERPADVAELAQLFVEQKAAGRRLRLSEQALDHLMHQRWEGNVRELENAIERAVALGEGEEIRPEDLAGSGAPGARDAEWHECILELVTRRIPLRHIEDRIIEETLLSTGGNMARAAALLGISRRTLYRRRAGP